MEKRKCDFECEFLDECGECEATQEQCIGDLCENWRRCQSCTNTEDCENVRM